jgi:hypothetical protein
VQDENEINVEQLEQQLKRKGIPLPFEIGAFIALEVCEQIVRAPVRVRKSNVWIGEVGEILIEVEDAKIPEADAVRSTLSLLGDLLVCSAPGVPPMLLELVEQGPGGERTLARLRDDLEACLLPLNRGATRRVLARLAREAQRVGDRASARPSGAPDANALDDDLDDLLGIGPGELPRAASPLHAPVPAQPPAAESPREAEREAEREVASRPAAEEPPAVAHKRIPALSTAAQLVSAAPPVAPVPKPRSPEPAFEVEAPAAPAAAVRASPAVAAPAQTARGPALRGEDLLDAAPARPSGGFVIGGLFFLIAVVLAIAYLTLGQLGARRLLGLSVPDATQGPGAAPPSAAAQPVSGELVVTSMPPRAQVFLFVGKGPALATDLPIGIAQEFVAITEGRAPTRAVIAPDATWEPGQGQPRYELAMQLGASLSPGSEPELGETQLPPRIGSPTGTLGTARVITAPPGARVYQLIGFTPGVRVAGLALDRDYELLISLPGHALVQRSVRADEFRGRGPLRIAELEIGLSKRKR